MLGGVELPFQTEHWAGGLVPTCQHTREDRHMQAYRHAQPQNDTNAPTLAQMHTQTQTHTHAQSLSLSPGQTNAAALRASWQS